MKRIALFISSLQKGGSERVMVNLAEHLHGKGYEVLLITQYKREVEYEIDSSIRRVFSEPDETLLQGNRVQNFCARFCALRKMWTDYKPDVILSFLGKNNFMAIMTSIGMPAKVAVSVRGEPSMEYPGRFNKLLTKLLFPFADGVIFQTEQAKLFFTKAVRKKSVVLSNPLNPQFLNVAEVSEKEDMIMAAGRLDENKNHAMLIHAFAKIAEEFPKTKLFIYGEGELRAELEKLVCEKQLVDRIFLPGSITNVGERMQKARIFTLTSNTEGMPNTVIEAMALGVPVISTDCPCGGPATLIEDGVNGLLVPVGDAFALADAMRKILLDAELEKRLGENAASIVEKLDPKKVNKEWETYLSSL